jgi:hypothetical protein
VGPTRWLRLQRDHNINPAIIPQRTWRNMYIQGKTPQQAADRRQ